MTSLFLGKIASKHHHYEIHALTRDLPYREFTCSEIADAALFQKIIEGRYELLCSGKPIYCTAISPDPEKKIEMNPHDTKEGTVHFVAIDEKGELNCAVGYSVDTGEKYRGASIGLPLENRYVSNRYPRGYDLDPFRERYLRLVHGKNRDLKPWEMCEVYRHFRRPNQPRDFVPRIGLYTGGYHLISRQAEKSGKTHPFVMHFAAIPNYFALYRIASGAVLTQPSIENPPRLISPRMKDFEMKTLNDVEEIRYEGKTISRSVRTVIPVCENENVRFEEKDVPMLPSSMDVHQTRNAIIRNPYLLSLNNFEGFEGMDRLRFRAGVCVVGRRAFEEDNKGSKSMIRWLNTAVLRSIGVIRWDFNEIGSLKNVDRHSYLWDVRDLR